MSDNDLPSDDAEQYVFSAEDAGIISATKVLLWKAARSEAVTPKQLEIIARMLQVFEVLPAVTSDDALQIQIIGPRRTFGTHEIYHCWNIEIEDESLCVTSQGYFYRPETGGDSFTSMIWRAFPGYATEHSDYLNTLSIVDDAQPFVLEVQDIDLGAGGYMLTVFENGEELEGDSSDDYENEDEDENDGTSESIDRDHSNQMTLKEAVNLLESADVECVWANRELTALYMVDLKELSLTDATYELFEHIPTLHTLEARNTDISDRSLVFISHLDSLEWLCLRRTAVTDEGLRHLRGLANLQHLDLIGTSVAGPGLVYLKGLVNLRELDVSGFQHHDQWLDMLRRELPQCKIYLN
jgi:hypothetical protein